MYVFTLDAVVFHQLCTIDQDLRGDVIYSLALEKAGLNHVPSKSNIYNKASIAIQSICFYLWQSQVNVS